MDGPMEADVRFQRLHLLVVDADPRAREAMVRRFSHMRYDVALAENAESALAKMATYRFDLVLVDLALEQPDGVEAIRRLRGAGLLHGASVISIAPHGEDSLALRALAAGADDHVAKPFDFGVVDLRLRHVVRRARQLNRMARHNELLDARIARRAMELGETRAELEELRADHGRLISSIEALNEEISRLSSAYAH